MPPPRPRPPRRPRADRVGLALAWLAVAVVGAGALASLDPVRAGLSATTPWAQLVTLRTAAGVLAMVLALLLGLVAVAVRVRRRRRLRRWPTPVVVLVACLVATGVGHGAVLLARSTPPALEAPEGGSALPSRPGDLVVTTFNVGPEGTPPGAVVETALRRDAHVLALTEAPEELARQVADGLAAAGRPVQLLSARGGERPPLRGRTTGLLLPFVEANTRLLVTADLGRYVAVEAGAGTADGVAGPPPLLGGAVVAVPADGDGPVLAAVHTLPAVPVLFDMGRWRSETAAAVALCGRLPGGVVAGDLNVTQDHAVLRDGPCLDAAAAGSDAAAGTWPSSLAPPLSAPIDHVLADPGTWSVAGTAVDRVGASDHRALTAVLRPRATG